ncbi:hypothetical protein QUB75_27040 [Microcoleus sp. K1-B6]|uniref:hypothetical protein n=1 Tax=unclassified Microcoleus TaxID=2642155 RepID=UPI002FD679D9
MASTNSWAGIGRQVLDQYLQSESGGGGSDDAGQMGLDIFNNGFEDEFPGDPEDPIAGTYQGYSLEANRASESRPWGGSFGERPKIHELNQPPAAQALGWRVIDFYPNRDFKSEFYRLAGTPAELRQMMQIVQATRFVTGARINFDAWFQQWELGFPQFNSDRATSNFALAGETQWKRIKEPETRPRYRELTNSQQRADLGYRVIEYWKDRSAEKSSVIMTGTDLLLINQIVQYEYQGGGGNVKINEKPNYLTTSRKGFPIIKLYFFEDILDVEPGYRALKSELKITVMKPEWKNISNISKNDIEQLAKSVKNIFYGFVIKKGKLTCSYKNLEQGYDNWTYVRTRAEGTRLMTELVKVLGHTLDRRFLRFTETDDEAGAYPIIPETITAFGEQIKGKRQRPIAETKFTHATIYLPGLTEPLGLVDSAGGTFKSTDNLV